MAKSHLLPPPSMGKQGRGGEAPAPADSGGPGRWNDDWDGENFLVRVKLGFRGLFVIIFEMARAWL